MVWWRRGNGVGPDPAAVDGRAAGTAGTAGTTSGAGATRPRPAGDPSDDPAPWRPRCRISLVSRPGCHLCDDVREVVARVAADLGVTWEEVSIDDHEELRAAYAEQIPVTLVDGRRHDYWRVDEARLRRALTA